MEALHDRLEKMYLNNEIDHSQYKFMTTDFRSQIQKGGQQRMASKKKVTRKRITKKTK